MRFPDFNEAGDLPAGIYKCTLEDALIRFGTGSLQRQIIARRLEKIFNLAQSTDKVLRFIVYGSFVSSKENPNDIDIFIVMDDGFDPEEMTEKARLIFRHITTQKYEGASIFWGTKSGIIGDLEEFIAGWQIKRDSTKRGILEVKLNDQE